MLTKEDAFGGSLPLASPEKKKQEDDMNFDNDSFMASMSTTLEEQAKLNPPPQPRVPVPMKVLPPPPDLSKILLPPPTNSNTANTPVNPNPPPIMNVQNPHSPSNINRQNPHAPSNMNVQNPHSPSSMNTQPQQSTNTSPTSNQRKPAGTGNLKCPHCEKTFVSKESARPHLEGHTGIKPFKCKLCDYTSNKIYNVNVIHFPKSHGRKGLDSDVITDEVQKNNLRETVMKDCERMKVEPEVDYGKNGTQATTTSPKSQTTTPGQGQSPGGTQQSSAPSSSPGSKPISNSSVTSTSNNITKPTSTIPLNKPFTPNTTAHPPIPPSTIFTCKLSEVPLKKEIRGQDACKPGKPAKLAAEKLKLHYVVHYLFRDTWNCIVPEEKPAELGRIELYRCNICQAVYKNHHERKEYSGRFFILCHMATDHGKLLEAMQTDHCVNMKSEIELMARTDGGKFIEPPPPQQAALKTWQLVSIKESIQWNRTINNNKVQPNKPVYPTTTTSHVSKTDAMKALEEGLMELETCKVLPPSKPVVLSPVKPKPPPPKKPDNMLPETRNLLAKWSEEEKKNGKNKQKPKDLAAIDAEFNKIVKSEPPKPKKVEPPPPPAPTEVKGTMSGNLNMNYVRKRKKIRLNLDDLDDDDYYDKDFDDGSKKGKGQRDLATGRIQRATNEDMMFDAANAGLNAKKTLRSNPDKNGIIDPGHKNPEDRSAWDPDYDPTIKKLPPRKARGMTYEDFGFGNSVEDIVRDNNSFKEKTSPRSAKLDKLDVNKNLKISDLLSDKENMKLLSSDDEKVSKSPFDRRKSSPKSSPKTSKKFDSDIDDIKLISSDEEKPSKSTPKRSPKSTPKSGKKNKLLDKSLPLFSDKEEEPEILLISDDDDIPLVDL